MERVVSDKYVWQPGEIEEVEPTPDLQMEDEESSQ